MSTAEQKDKIISDLYNDPAGFGSIQTTYKDARKKDKTITLKYVQDWFQRNVEQKKQLRGFNSFVANKPFQEFQVDLFFYKNTTETRYERKKRLEKKGDVGDKPEETESKTGKFSSALIAVDIFTKYTTVVPIKTKQPPDVLAGLMEVMQKMKGKPEMVYSDDEGSFTSSLVKDWFDKEKIKHVITRTHAPVAERNIRTIKAMIDKRIEKAPAGTEWTDLLYPVLLTYNNKMEHSATGLTPEDARKDRNHMKVKAKLEVNRVSKRKYPDVSVGDKVKVYTKKDKLDKERISVWSKDSFEVTGVETSHGQKYYKVAGRDRPLLRHEILLVKS